MKTFQKHHFNPWRDGLLCAESECARCKVQVRVGRTGGTKFWVNGRWTPKRPPCEPKPES